MLAKLGQRAAVTSRRTSYAHLSAKPNYAVTKIRLLLRLDKLSQCVFHPCRVLLRFGIEAKPAADAYAMSIRNNSGEMIYISEQQICNFSSHPREKQERIHILRQLSSVFIAQQGTSRLDACRLGAKQSAGAYYVLNFGQLSVRKSTCRRESVKQRFAHDIYTCIGALCRKPAHYKQLPRLPVIFKCTGRLGVPLLKQGHYFRHSFTLGKQLFAYSFSLTHTQSSFLPLCAQKYVPICPPSSKT